jgi:uncharacterized SAM-dependent methyltransferase
MARMKRTPRGVKPQYFADPATDRLHEMVLALTAELSVTRDRLATLEAVLAEQGVIGPELIESHTADADQQLIRHQARQALAARILRPLERDLEAVASSAETHDVLAQELSRG